MICLDLDSEKVNFDVLKALVQAAMRFLSYQGVIFYNFPFFINMEFFPLKSGSVNISSTVYFAVLYSRNGAV